MQPSLPEAHPPMAVQPEALPGAAILVVDDDPAILRLVEDLLGREEGFCVHGARSGAEALAWHPLEPPALIILDLSLPGEGTADLVACLRARPGWGSVPLVLCSGRPALRRVAREVGAVAALSKPFHIETMVALARRYAG